ncbi:PPE family protein [Mycobacterium sp. SM1]|uniref:PPE family protein n=1 Tax=Mycobacterium sp. SM1 TaxID=2816243 RepID=UPI001BD19F07|nr:PPE family protein [Mycobacterium sp. SM1]MBS4730605.1 PPE family protein [Mycobacterium sp. SM1]
MALDVIAPPIWAAAPPEVHSTLLTTGATAASITAAATSWTHLAAEYIAALAELEGIIATIQANYQGPSAEQFVMAHQPMLMWLADVAAKAEAAAAAHADIAAAYEGAVVAMPTLAELFENHFVHGVLVATNFFGVNTIPIALNEADYQRMWQLAADVMTTWDGTSTAAANSIPPTPMSPITLIPGVGEAGSAAATAMSAGYMPAAQAGGAALTSSEMMGNTLLTGKAATSPLSFTDGMPNPVNATQDAADQPNNAAMQGQSALNPQNMAGNFMQEASSIGPTAAQSVTSAAPGPSQLLTSAPQQLASAPQQLGSMLTQFAGSAGAGANTNLGQGAMPVGFAGTGAIRGFNPAGVTSLAGGAMGSGPSRPLMPSTWGTPPTSAAEALTNSARAITPVATGLPGGSAASGSGAGAGMMGTGAHSGRSRSQRVSTYADDPVDEDAAADSDGRRT